MFTGIVEELGTVQALENRSDSRRLGIRCGFEAGSVHPGDSVAVDGACLTVTSILDDVLHFDVSHETVSATTLKLLKTGDRVHLERALRLGARLGGHLVTGHVDGVGELVARSPQGENLDLAILAPSAVAPFLVPKGSVAVDGVSLTVNQPGSGRFRVTLVPHTLAQTRLGERRPGDPVNLEADLLGKYVRHFVGGRGTGSVDRSMLVEHGFLDPEDGT